MLNMRDGTVVPTGAEELSADDDELRIYIVMRKDLTRTIPERFAWFWNPFYRFFGITVPPQPMSRAKFGVQCAHAALTAWALCLDRDPDKARAYIMHAQAKIVLQVRDEAELRTLYERVRAIGGMDVALITDAGRTEFAKPTMTCLAVGPVWFRTEGQPLFKRIRLYKE
jgi:peptidyl-tRNA hydrolase